MQEDGRTLMLPLLYVSNLMKTRAPRDNSRSAPPPVSRDKLQGRHTPAETRYRRG